MKINLNITAVNLKYNKLTTPQEITLDLGLDDLVTLCSSSSKNTLNEKEPLINESFVLLNKNEFNDLLSKANLLRGILKEIKK